MALRKILGDGKIVPGKAVSEPYKTDEHCPECGLSITGYDVTLPMVGVLKQVYPCPCLALSAELDHDAKLLELAGINRENDRLNRQRRFEHLELGEMNPKYVLEDLHGHQGNLRAAVAVKGLLENSIAAGTTKGLSGFALFGPYSVGKSFLAGGLVRALMAAKIGAVIVNPVDLQDGIQRTFEDSSKVKTSELLSDLKNVPLLVLDDVGREQVRGSGGEAKEFFHAKLFAMLDARIAKQLPIIITTNYTPTELATRYSASEYGVALIERFIEIFGGTSSNWIHVTDTHSRRTGAAIPGR